MAHYQNQYGAVQSDEYGNTICQAEADELARPVHQTATMGDYGTTGTVTGTTGAYGREIDEYGNPVHPTGSISTGTYGTGIGTGGYGIQTDEYGNPVQGTSTMGDYGTSTGKTGGYGRQTDEYGNPIHHTGTMADYGTTGTGTYGTRGERHKKKGVLEKIKEKLPGHHHH